MAPARVVHEGDATAPPRRRAMDGQRHVSTACKHDPAARQRLARHRVSRFRIAEPGTVEERIARLESIELPAHVHRVTHELCGGMHDLDKRERDVVAAGGEGLVIRRPGSPYRPGRAGDIIKIKRLQPDTDRSL